ncbi:MAG: hypothetical protein WB757_03640, partial [Candidatus Cybelea sp.]
NGLGLIALQGASKVVAAVRTLISAPERLAAIRENQESVAPRHSSRRIAALITSITETGTIPASDDAALPTLRAAAV